MEGAVASAFKSRLKRRGIQAIEYIVILLNISILTYLYIVKSGGILAGEITELQPSVNSGSL